MQGTKGEQLVSMMSSFEKTFVLVGEDIVELSTKNEILEKTISSYDDVTKLV